MDTSPAVSSADEQKDHHILNALATIERECLQHWYGPSRDAVQQFICSRREQLLPPNLAAEKEFLLSIIAGPHAEKATQNDCRCPSCRETLIGRMAMFITGTLVLHVECADDEGLTRERFGRAGITRATLAALYPEPAA